MPIMNPEHSNHDDPKLDGLLHGWKVETTLPPRFQEQVWHRVAAQEAPALSPVVVLQNWIAQLILRPSFALSYASILLMLGLLGGVWQARATSHLTSEKLSARYVQMVDPYQMPRP
jgi:hypothetical protein